MLPCFNLSVYLFGVLHVFYTGGALIHGSCLYFWAAGVRPAVDSRVASLGWAKSLSCCWSFTSSLSLPPPFQYLLRQWDEYFRSQHCVPFVSVQCWTPPQIVRCLHPAKKTLRRLTLRWCLLLQLNFCHLYPFLSPTLQLSQDCMDNSKVKSLLNNQRGSFPQTTDTLTKVCILYVAKFLQQCHITFTWHTYELTFMSVDGVCKRETSGYY